MKRAVLLMILAALLAPMAVRAVEPAYLGEYGNAEEPALRPYKWVWRGVQALFYQTGHGFAHGNMKTPILGTAETFRGLRKGTVELGESAYHGLAFAPAPRKGDFKKISTWNETIDNEKVRSNFSDLVFSLYAFPVLKFVDKYPAENESRVQIRTERAKATREAQRKSAAERQLQNAATTGKKDTGRGNLLKLAK